MHAANNSKTSVACEIMFQFVNIRLVMNVQLWFGFGRFGVKNNLKGWKVGNLFFHWAEESKF